MRACSADFAVGLLRRGAVSPRLVIFTPVRLMQDQYSLIVRHRCADGRAEGTVFPPPHCSAAANHTCGLPRAPAAWYRRIVELFYTNYRSILLHCRRRWWVCRGNEKCRRCVPSALGVPRGGRPFEACTRWRARASATSAGRGVGVRFVTLRDALRCLVALAHGRRVPARTRCAGVVRVDRVLQPVAR
jgi:hypothetical protein